MAPLLSAVPPLLTPPSGLTPSPPVTQMHPLWGRPPDLGLVEKPHPGATLPGFPQMCFLPHGLQDCQQHRGPQHHPAPCPAPQTLPVSAALGPADLGGEPGCCSAGIGVDQAGLVAEISEFTEDTLRWGASVVAQSSAFPVVALGQGAQRWGGSCGAAGRAWASSRPGLVSSGSFISAHVKWCSTRRGTFSSIFTRIPARPRWASSSARSAHSCSCRSQN